MKPLAFFVFAIFLSSSALATTESKEKPTQHLKIADVTSMDEAKEVFLDSTAKIRRLKTLNPESASQIHIITYTLEKSVAYFAENLKGDKQALAKEMAVVVEDIHLASENNRLEKLQEHIDRYFSAVDKLIFCF